MKVFVLTMACLALTSTAALAEPTGRTKTPLISVSCSDLRAEVRANHAECAIQPSAILQPTLIAETRTVAGTKRMIRMPWMIGVFQ